MNSSADAQRLSSWMNPPCFQYVPTYLLRLGSHSHISGIFSHTKPAERTILEQCLKTITNNLLSNFTQIQTQTTSIRIRIHIHFHFHPLHTSGNYVHIVSHLPFSGTCQPKSSHFSCSFPFRLDGSALPNGIATDELWEISIEEYVM